MLSSISIKKFLYIKDLDIDFSPNMNVFTGETGVGKSLIIDAITFVLGERGNYEEGDFVELTFEVESPYSEEGLLVLARQIKNGKSLYYINGRKSGKSLIEEISRDIIEIHGQHYSQRLFDKDYHREIYDKYLKIENKLLEYQKIYNTYQKLKKEYEDIIQKHTDRVRKIEFLNFQINELKNANLKEGEKQKLEEEYNYYSNIQTVRESVEFIKSIISQDNCGILQNLSLALKSVSKIANLNEKLSQILYNLENTKNIIEDTYYSLEDFELDYDANKLSQLEERLNLINTLERKYMTDEKGLIELLKQMEEELNTLLNLENKAPELEKQLEEVENQLIKMAKEISDIRKSKVEEFEKLVIQHLKDLAFKSADFKVLIEEKNLDKYGVDKIQFLFSANKGFDPKPLEEIASGGEISRISLVLKLISKKSVNTMIFDEIDTGIGGMTAISMAKKLKQLSKDFQVILITHLPQIAVVGDRHFYVDKKEENGITIAHIRQLNQDDRINEIARMLSGIVNEESINLAKELLKQGERWTR
jgi:DNA repair protein RecN (Recombination protein N)